MLQFPIILIRGLVDTPKLNQSWKVVERTLAERGIEYFRLQISSHGTILERTQYAIAKIVAKYPNRHVHLFGHSLVRVPWHIIGNQSSFMLTLFLGRLNCPRYRSEDRYRFHSSDRYYICKAALVETLAVGSTLSLHLGYSALRNSGF
jgi:hypothetical protein